jgi:predicted dehydrogenase
MDITRVGVVGVGHLGAHHARIYAEILGCRLAGVVDVCEERAAAVGESLGVPYFTDLDRFVAECRIDAASVVVPTSLHYDVARALMDRGIHVLIEKPVTTRVEQAEELLRLAGRNLESRWDSGTVQQRGPARGGGGYKKGGGGGWGERGGGGEKGGILSEPLFIESRRMGPFSPRISDVGVVLDLMIHDIDIILSLVRSEIFDLTAVGRSVRTDHEDIAAAQLAFANGTLARILVSRVSERRIRQMEIMEPDRYLTVNFETQDVSIHRCIRENGAGLVEVIEHPVIPKKEPLRLELQHFVTCVREGRQPLVGINDGKRALEVCISVLRQIHFEVPAERPLVACS